MGKRAMREYWARKRFEEYVKTLDEWPEEVFVDSDGLLCYPDGRPIPDGDYRTADGRIRAYEGNFLRNVK